jgi:Flp pilus assembly pilin Flp
LDRPGYSEPAYPSTPYPDGDFDAPGYDDSGYESGYDEPDYSPDYGEAEYDEPDQGYPPADSARGAVPPPRSSGQKHTGEWEGGEWTGSHRAVTAGRRGVSVGVIAALVAVVVIVGAFILWRFFGDALSHRTDALAARCVNGELAVAVVADPSIAEQVHKLADSFNKSAAPVADKCVKVDVRPADSDQVVNGFIGKWPAELGERPALWIPARSPSATAARLSPRPCSLPSDLNSKMLWLNRTGARCPVCRPTRMGWTA